MSKTKVRFDEVVFSFVFKGLPEVIPEDILAEKLEALEFEINKGEKVFKLPIGEVVITNFAKKGGVDILYDPRESSIGIGTKTGDVGILVNHLDSLSDLFNNLDTDAESFYRIIARGKAWYGKNVKDVIRRTLEVKLDNVEEILGVDIKLQPMTLRLIPVEKKFGEVPWVDIIIEPLVSNPKYYYVQFVYRNSDYDKSRQMLVELKDKVSKLLSCLGSG